MALGKNSEDAPESSAEEQASVSGEEIAALQEQIAAKDSEIEELTANNSVLQEEISALKATKGKDAPKVVVKMEKPGSFFAAVNKISDPYAERTFYPDSTRPTEVRPMTSWVDCQIKAGVLLRVK